MKKILFFLFLAMPLMGYAQKSYIHIYVNGYMNRGAYGQSMYLTGDIPNGFDNSYGPGDGEKKMTIGTLLNKLSKEGFIIESQSMAAYASTTDSGTKEIIIMSRSGSSNPSKIQSVTIEGDGDPYEVARYNLQGMPVKENEKGVQIIVYSNYTTKTVIVE